MGFTSWPNSTFIFCFMTLVGHSLWAQENPRSRPPQSQAQAAQAVGGQQGAKTDQLAVGPPAEFQLSPEQDARIHRMLEVWEKQTSGIKTFRTAFTRWQWDPVFGPKNQPKKITGGEIRYALPDKGMIKETKVAVYNAKKAAAGEKWPFVMVPGEVGEHWVCDGKSIFEINHQTKQLIETKLPPEMQGKAIAEGPLPFMFGAKAATIRNRYWVREIPRTKEEDPYHLEFVPKGRGASYSRVRVRLDPKKFMPDVLEVHELNNMGRSVYQFEKRRVNAVTDNVKAFWDVFVRPETPVGFERVQLEAGNGPSQPLEQAQRGGNPRK